MKSVGRANGRSIVAAAAYRSGERLEDERTGETADYRARGGVLETFILTRDDTPAWAQDRAHLWNAAESAENRANGRLATELELALPCELDADTRKRLLKDFLAPIIARHGVAADVAIHEPGEGRDHRNIHAHVLLTHRELGPDGFGDIANTRTVTRQRKGREVQEQVAGIAATPPDIRNIRKTWEEAVNREYERAGLDIRVDHRSHEDRGIQQEPTQHLGPNASAMERRGETTERGDINRDVDQRNEARRFEAEIAAIKAQIAALQPDQIFASAAARVTEPFAPTFDRDASEAAWTDKLIAAAIAKDTAQPPQEASPQPDKAAVVETRAAAVERSEAPSDAPRATVQAEPDAEIKSADAVAGKVTGGLARIFTDVLGGILNFFAGGPPKQTAAQIHQQQQAAGNLETIHAADYAKSVQANEAERDERIFRADQEQQLPLAAPEYFRAITRPANPADRQRDDDHGRELERER